MFVFWFKWGLLCCGLFALLIFSFVVILFVFVVLIALALVC